MGPGIFTRHSKLVFGSILAIFALITAVQLYYQFRSPVGGVSPYETVNDLFEQDLLSFTIERDTYPTDVKVIQITLRNDADDIVVGEVSVQSCKILSNAVGGRYIPDCLS